MTQIAVIKAHADKGHLKPLQASVRTVLPAQMAAATSLQAVDMAV